jgi:hypothetical protein
VFPDDIDSGSADKFVRTAVDAAASERRRRTANRQRWREAPWVAAGCLCVAAATRWFGGPALLPFAAVLLAAGIVIARSTAPRGVRASDRDIATIDDDAGLAGELRSAAWFAGLSERDRWAECHLARAAARLRGISWAALYPRVPAGRAQLTTAALVLGTVVLSITSPSAARPHGGSPPKTAVFSQLSPAADRAEADLPELQKQLEALLVAAETGGRLRSDLRDAADQRRLIAGIEALRAAGRLADLAHALAPATNGANISPVADVTALAERIRAAARRPNVAPEVREALEKVSETFSEDGGRLGSPKEPSPNAGASRDTSGDLVRGKGPGPVDETTIQSLRESDAGAGTAGTMASSGAGDAPKKTSPGRGLGGGSDGEHEAARIAGLEAVLRRSTIEAATEGAGQTLQTDVRHNTDRGEATAAYTHAAPGAVDRGHAVAPPAVPEARRSAVQGYFLRKR